MRDHESVESRLPYVVKRREVPVSPDAGHLDLRPFAGHERLAPAVASGSARLNWLELREGEAAGPYRNADRGLLIVLRGAAEFVSSTKRFIESGDVITLPANQEYGICAARGGFGALELVFREELTASAGGGATLEDVLAHNERRLRAWLETPYFCMLRDGTMATSASRTRFKQCIRVFSDFFQTFLFSRQAMCRDAGYHSVFGEHLAEEFGHNNMLEPPRDPRVCADPSLHATLSWFCHQMLTLDNAGKAVINLVLESAGYHFHNVAKSAFQADDVSGYFSTHAEDDEHHMDMGLELLQGEHTTTYESLIETVDRGWDILEATTERIFELVHLPEASS